MNSFCFKRENNINCTDANIVDCEEGNIKMQQNFVLTLAGAHAIVGVSTSKKHKQCVLPKWKTEEQESILAVQYYKPNKRIQCRAALL